LGKQMLELMARLTFGWSEINIQDDVIHTHALKKNCPEYY